MSDKFDDLRDIDRVAETFIVNTMKLHPRGIKLSLLIENAIKEGFSVLTASRALQRVLDSQDLLPKLPEGGKSDMSASINEPTAKILGPKEQQELIEQLKVEMRIVSNLQQEIEMQNIPSGNVISFLQGKWKGLHQALIIIDNNIRLSQNTGK